MKKYLLGLLLALTLTCGTVTSYASNTTTAAPPTSLLAAEAPAPAPAADSAAPESGAQAQPAAEETASEEAADSGPSGWKKVAGLALEIALPIIALLVIGFGVPLARKLLKKAGLEDTKLVEEILTSLVKKGINYAEGEAARFQKEGEPGLDGSGKKAQAVAFILEQAKKHKLGDLAEDYIGNLIEGQLARDKQK